METEQIFIYIYTRNTRNCEFHTQNSDLLFTFSCQAFANLTKPQILHQKNTRNTQTSPLMNLCLRWRMYIHSDIHTRIHIHIYIYIHRYRNKQRYTQLQRLHALRSSKLISKKKNSKKKKLIQKQNKYRIHTNTLNYKADKKKKYTKIEKEI